MIPRVSIIVPVFNSGQYLPCCIDSVLGQSFSDFELLLIDDGSTDTSGAICDEYAEKDNRVRVFHKENGGVSSARNLGLDQARGEWVSFVDSDDSIGKHCLIHMMSVKSDLVIVGYRKHSRGETTIHAPNSMACLKIGELPVRWNLPNMNYLYCFPWGKLFRTRIIKENNIRFNENLFYQEDLCFVLSYMMHTDDFVEMPYPDYEYMMMDVHRAEKFKMNAKQMITHHDALNALFDQMESKCKGGFNYVRDNVNLRLLRCFYAFLQDCFVFKEYRMNSRLFRQQNWSKQLLGLLKGKKEKRVMYGAYYCPALSYLVENGFAHR